MRNYEETYEENINKKSSRKVRKKESGILFGDFISKGQWNSYLFWLIFLLSIIGLIMVFSSSYYKSIQTYGNGYHFFKTQFFAFIVGLVAMFIISKVNYKIYKKYLAPFVYGLAIILLAVVFVKGQVLKGANRWIDIGPFSFQPSEFMKIAMCMILAVVLSNRKDSSEYLPSEKKNFIGKVIYSFKVYKKEFIYLLVPFFMILIENWSTAAIFLFTGLIILYVDGFKLERWMGLLVICVLMLIVFIKLGGIQKVQELNLFDGKYNARLDRLVDWLDPFDDPLDGGYQTVQSLYGIGSGGITGVGIGKSKLKLGYLPEAYNDMIFTIICEEFGLIGATVVLGIFIALIIECIKVAIKAPDKFSKYYTVGIISYITLQVLVNVGVATGLLPNTGMPLPFISYGGSSLLMAMAGMGIVLNITRYED